MGSVGHEGLAQRSKSIALRAYGELGALGLYGLLRGLTRTCRVERAGEGAHANGAPSRIYCYWHQDAFPGFVFLMGDSRPMNCLCHPAWQLAPWISLGRKMGWGVSLGSAGHGGRRASAQVVAALRAGASTFVCPDGPAGPPRVLKQGVLHMALASGAPIVPVRFDCERAIELPRWDALRLPVPGSVIRAECGEEVYVTEANFAQSAERVVGFLTRA